MVCNYRQQAHKMATRAQLSEISALVGVSVPIGAA